MEVPIWGLMTQGTLVTSMREYTVGPGQKWGQAWWMLPISGWIFLTGYFELLSPDEEDWRGVLSDHFLVESGTADGIEGMAIEIDDSDFWEVTDVILTAPGRQYPVGPGQKYEYALLAVPGEYYIEEFDEWIAIMFWAIRLFQADGTERVLYATNCSIEGVA